MNREDLKNYKYSQEWIKSEISKYKEMKTQVDNISPNLSGMPNGKNHISYALENLMDKYDEIIKKLVSEQDKLNEIINQLNQLKPIYKLILTERYINGRSLEEISTVINYSYYRTCRINGDALNEFDKVGNFGQDLAKKI